MAKPEIRAIARSFGLKVADKVDSQEICFVPGNDYKAFLRSHLGEGEFHRGGIYDLSGNFLAEHEGIEMFTIGQRKGLPAARRGLATWSISMRRAIALSSARRRTCWLRNLKSIASTGAVATASDEPLAVTVKIRYSHPGTAATLTPLEGSRALVRLEEPQKAVTPGQAAVCYDGDIVVAGGWICRPAAVAAA